MRRGRFLILIALLLVLSMAGIFVAVALSGGLPALLGNRAGGAGTPQQPAARHPFRLRPRRSRCCKSWPPARTWSAAR